ncbi:uncharacterized protein [Dermacentor albipictus]|uniref:uncharacterized protein n=1 Tax=Dermacentor albipictus TaxID=60249 RepID=UPI0031FCBE8A
MAGVGKPRVPSPGTTDHVRSTDMTLVPRLVCIVLVCFANVSVTTARPIRNGTATPVASNVTTPPTTTSYAGEPPAWRQNEWSADSGHSRPPLTLLSLQPGCRKRVFCESARTLTYAFPISRSWQGEVRQRPVPANAYFDAWSKGMLGHDCSHLYEDCSDSPAGLVMPLLRMAIGPNGFLGSLVERVAAASMRQALMDHEAPPRTSLVMEKLRRGERRLAAAEPQMPSSEFTPR